MPYDNPPQTQDGKPRKKIQKILIADDRYENRYLLQAMLEGNGYQVIAAENGLDAVEKMKTGQTDAIISDILMPIMDGFQFCRTIRGDPKFAHVPFIFYTASYIEQKDREFGLSLGADEYIIKPVEPEEFLAIIRKVFERAEEGEIDATEKPPPNNLSYYTSYADVLGRKLDKKVIESEKHKVEARFNEEKYQIFLENLQGIGYLIQKEEDTPVIIAGQVEEITGYPATEFLSGRLKWQDIIHPDDHEGYLWEKGRVGPLNGNKFSHQYRITHKNGEIRWVHEIASGLLGQDPENILIQGAIYDNTPQKQAEERIRISEEQYRTLFETMVEGVVYQDKDGNITDTNPAAERILGLTLDEMQGRTSLDPRWKSVQKDGSLLPGEDHPAMVSLRTGQKNSQIMGIFNPRDNRQHWILVNAIPQFLPGENSPYQVYTTFEDITKEKEARDHIEHLNRILKALRLVNLLITDETENEVLLSKVCSSLAQEGGYLGIWVRLESEGSVIFQAISDPLLKGSQYDRDTSQGYIDSWFNSIRFSSDPITTHSIQINNSGKNSNPVREGYGVMVSRLSYADREYGRICVCIPDVYVHDTDEQSLFLEIARDIGFALHHIHVLHQEETARNALCMSEKQYRELVETISDTIFTVNTDGVCTYISPSISTITGSPPSLYIGRKYLDFIHPDDRSEVDQWFKNILLDTIVPVEFRIINEKKEVRYIRVKATPVVENNEIVEISGIISDITAWKESEKLKAERTKEVQTLLSLHHLTHDTEQSIFTFTLNAALDITQSEIGFIAFVHKGGKKADFQIWSPEVLKTCSIQIPSTHTITSSSGLWSECITTKKPVIINDFSSQSDGHEYPEGHVPILRFLEVPILDGDHVTAIIAVANRMEPYTDAHANVLNTLGNTLWGIILRKQSDQEIKTALTQIAKNMEQMATLNDTIRNPLSIIVAVTDLVDESYKKLLIDAVHNIDFMITQLDQGWIQSEKVKNFLIKHYQFKREDF